MEPQVLCLCGGGLRNGGIGADPRSKRCRSLPVCHLQGMINVKQTTLADRVVIKGIGVHSGQPACVVLHPSEPHSGISFLRTHLAHGRERMIEARNHAVRNTELCTVIGDESGATISTVEHLMSALAGLGVDNVVVEVDGPEMPILDGSARLFVDAIDQVGIVTQSALRKVIKVLKPVRVEHGASVVELLPRDAGFRLDLEIAFENPVIGRQAYGFELAADRYRREISSARTFGFMRDVERLWKAGLALGASLENTVAVGEDKVVNPEGLRFPMNSCAINCSMPLVILRWQAMRFKGITRRSAPATSSISWFSTRFFPIAALMPFLSRPAARFAALVMPCRRCPPMRRT